MERPLLNDKDQYPDDEVLAGVLGRAKPAWDAFAASAASGLGPDALEWRYYNDGKAWLCKVVHKKKTVCWVSMWERFFKVVFYFTAKNDADIEGLPISADIKTRYREYPPIGKLKPVTVEVANKRALEAVDVLIGYKAGLR
jgi:hypothetical protein